MNKFAWRFAIKTLYLSALVGAGTMRIIDGDVASGSSFLAASIGVFAAVTLRQRQKLSQADQSGTVLYDERHQLMAGKAALFTVRVMLVVLSGAMLLTFAVNPEWEMPLIVPVGVTLFLTSVILRLSYRRFVRD